MKANRILQALKLNVTSATILSSLAAAPVVAQESEAGRHARAPLEEVVVTARRRDESLQEVPMSVMSFGQLELDRKGIRNVNDLSSIAPGLSIQNTGNNRRKPTFSIRGQGQTIGQNSPGVVAYFAEVPDPYLGSASSSSLYFFDLEQVQVLKGPQGTLFGRNTTGGAVLFTPRKPAQDWSGSLMVRVGNYNQNDYEFAVGGGLIPDRLAFRVAGQLQNRDGYTREINSGVWLDDSNRRSYRASLVWVPFDGFENYTIYTYEKVDENGSGSLLTDARPVPATSGLAPGFPALFPSLQQALQDQQQLGIRKVAYGWPVSSKARMDGFINTTTWAVHDHITLKNIYSDRDFDATRGNDGDASAVPLLGVLNPWIHEPWQKTEEFQVQAHFGNIDALVGYYYEKSRKPIAMEYLVNQFSVLGAVGYGGQGYKSEAYFTQVDFQITDELSLSAGVRRTKDEVRYDVSSAQTFLWGLQPVPPAPATWAGPMMTSSSATTWNAAASYALTPDVNLYATVRRGYKAGGINSTAILAEQLTFEPEYVTDYELGVKSQFEIAGWQVRANADIFYNDYEDIQRLITVPSIPPSTVSANAAKGKVSGIDLDLTISPSELFRLAISYAYMDARYGDYVDPALGDLSESNFPNSPKHQLVVTPELIFPVPAEMGRVSLLASYYYQSETYVDTANVPNGNPQVELISRGAHVPSYEKLDIRFDWQNVYGSSVSLGAHLRNATDEEYVLTRGNSLSSLGTLTSLYGEPRTYGVEIRYDF